MFRKKESKKISPEAREQINAALTEIFGDATPVTDAPPKQYMLKWLSAFAPDMTYDRAKAFCLPRLFYKNHLWNAFAFEEAPCTAGEEALEAAGKTDFGECYLLLEDEKMLFAVKNAGENVPEKLENPENLKNLKNLKSVVVFTKDFSKTYVKTGEEGFGPYFKTAEE